MRGIEIVRVEMKSVLEGLPTSALHMAIQAPFCGGIVEAGPSAPNGDFVSMLIAHRFVKVIKVLLTPIAAVRRPAFLSRLDPGKHSGKISRIFGRWFVF